MQWSTIVAIVFAAIKSAWSGGSPFAVQTVLYPLNEENKYIIESEGVRLAFTLNGGALSNLWINDTHGIERDIVLGFDQADDVRGWVGNPWLNGVIGRVAGFLKDPVRLLSHSIYSCTASVYQNYSALTLTEWQFRTTR